MFDSSVVTLVAECSADDSGGCFGMVQSLYVRYFGIVCFQTLPGTVADTSENINIFDPR
jgi:hypothetical protein